jgi:hypothetical protein
LEFVQGVEGSGEVTRNRRPGSEVRDDLAERHRLEPEEHRT